LLGAAASVASSAVGMVEAVASLIPATMICKDPKFAMAGLPFSAIPFDFNPKNISITRTTTWNTRAATPGAGSPTGSQGAIVSTVKPPEISISDIYFEGITTKLRMDTLLAWMSPPGGMAALGGALASGGRPINTQPPTVLFQWGPPMVGFWYDVKLTNVSITYERFLPLGVPVRAKVSIKMIQQKSDLSNLPTNPTSGGLPGRHTHVVRDGDTLPSISTNYYETPAAWRRIADINGIDDPHRLRIGSTLYLPTMEELENGLVR
jgi:nucleoid-associated protein YgaU